MAAAVGAAGHRASAVSGSRARRRERDKGGMGQMLVFCSFSLHLTAGAACIQEALASSLVVSSQALPPPPTEVCFHGDSKP